MSPRSPPRSRCACPAGNTVRIAWQVGDTTMSTQFLSVGGVASILAHLLLVGAGLVLKGLALKQPKTAARFAVMSAALACVVTGLVLASDWAERAGLIFCAALFAP